MSEYSLAPVPGIKKARHYFWLFIVIHTLIWTIGPALLRPTLPHDALEGITWGLQWQWGYNKHPFLAAWLCAGVTKLFGVTGWPIYLLAQLAVSITFIAVWRLAQQLLPPLHALLAALVLEGVLFYNINSFNFTPDTLQSPLWALLSLFFYQAITKQNLSNWLCTGLFAALCFCTKYQVVLMLLPMLLLCLFNSDARKSFAKPGIYYSLIFFILLITPHLFWLYHHQFITLSYAKNISADYTQNKSFFNYFTHPLGFMLNSLIDIIGVFILLWPFYGRSKIKLQLSSFQKQFIIALGFGPLILSFLLCCITGDYFPPRWSTPYFFMLGIIGLSYLKPVLSKKQLHQFGATLIIIGSLLFIVRMGTLSLFPRVSSDAFLPNKQIAAELSQLWQQHYHSPVPYLAGSHYLVAGILPYIYSHPIPYLSWEIEDSSWLDEGQLRYHGGLFIWDKNGYYTWDKQSQKHTGLSSSILQRFPTLKIMPDYTFYRLSDNQAIKIGVAILPPNSN